LRVAVFRQGFVQTCSRYTNLSGYFGHAFGSCGSVQGVYQAGRVACLRNLAQKFTNVFIGFKMGRNVEFSGLNDHYLIAKILHQTRRIP
jgi:hypothetical protein